MRAIHSFHAESRSPPTGAATTSTGSWPTRPCSGGPASRRARRSTSGPGPATRTSGGPSVATSRHRPGHPGARRGRRHRQADPRSCGHGVPAVVAVEPSASMRQVFAAMLPGRAQVGGHRRTASLRRRDSMRRRRGAQAFHWFDARRGPGRVRPGAAPGRRPRPGVERAGRVRPDRRRAHPGQQVGRAPALPGGDGLRRGSSTPSRLFGPGDADPVPLHPGARPARVRRAGRLAQLHRRPARRPAPGHPRRGRRPGGRGSTSRSACPTSPTSSAPGST